MPDQAAYDRSTLDMERLQRYAARVARDLGGTPPRFEERTEIVQRPEQITSWFGLRTKTVTREVSVVRKVAIPGSSWLLDRREWSSRTKLAKRGEYSEDQELLFYELRHDGSLIVKTEQHAEGIADGRFFTTGCQSSEMPFTENDVLMFDFEYRFQRTNSGHRTGRGRLRVHAKGVGLSLALKKLSVDR